MINEELTDLDRVELTKLSYEALNVGETVVVAGKKIGQLTRDVYAKDGMQAFLSRTGRMANYLRYRRNLQADWQKESDQRAEQIGEELFNHSFCKISMTETKMQKMVKNNKISCKRRVS